MDDELPIQSWKLKPESAMSLKEKQVYEVTSLEQQLNKIAKKYGQATANNLIVRITNPDPWLETFYEKWTTFTP
ncbi:MAG: hypothetical protein ACPGR8_12940, partial [Limisphaerales bacterium]